MSDLLDSGSNRSNFGSGTLPNATAVLILGIISIVTCLFYGVPGIVCGIIAIVLHRKDKTIYLSDTDKYGNAFKTSRAGWICGIVGLSISAIWFVFWLIMIVIGLTAAGRIR